jgi:hypothetical protein
LLSINPYFKTERRSPIRRFLPRARFQLRRPLRAQSQILLEQAKCLVFVARREQLQRQPENLPFPFAKLCRDNSGAGRAIVSLIVVSSLTWPVLRY